MKRIVLIAVTIDPCDYEDEEDTPEGTTELMTAIIDESIRKTKLWPSRRTLRVTTLRDDARLDDVRVDMSKNRRNKNRRAKL